MKNTRTPVISVVEENCTNCHKCISVCPVKYCIDGSKEKVSINHDLCIGCGHCIEACDHDARTWQDDFPEFIEAFRKGEKTIAIVAPAVAASFPGNWRYLMGYLQTLGIEAFFDVALGAELTVRSYLEYIKSEQPQTIISQPCPAIVSYIELYQPELIPYLAPADSPMVHTMKLIRAKWPEYKNRKIVVISPCLAKKREFEDTGYGDFNVTIRSLQKWLSHEKILLKNFREADFTGPEGERAVRFSTPGGLMLTAERDSPGIAQKTRKIEGSGIFEYLKALPASIKGNYSPALIDCLNCEKGCNGGPGTVHQKTAHDLLDYRVENRVKIASPRNGKASKKVNKDIEKYWEKGLYVRTYTDFSRLNTIKKPSELDIQHIYRKMKKENKEDFLNCASCGYGSCEGMAVAIYNNLNKPENCHHFRHEVILREKETISDLYGKLHVKINNCKDLIKEMNQAVDKVTNSVEVQSSSLAESSAAIEQMVRALGSLSRISHTRQQALASLDDSVRTGAKDLEQTILSIDEIISSVEGIENLISMISEVADLTSLLSMNAAIEAAHAGNSGKGFAVVAGEIKKLANTTGNNVHNVSELIENIQKKVRETSDVSGKTSRNIGLVLSEVQNLSVALQEFLNHTEEMAMGNKEVNTSLAELKNTSAEVLNASCFMSGKINGLEEKLQDIVMLSDQNMEKIRQISEAN